MALALAWSGGKDSALALHALRSAGTPPAALLTTVDEAAAVTTVHRVPVELLRAQAAAAGVPLAEVPVPDPCPDDEYIRRMEAAFGRPPLDSVRAVAFGDLFLADLRAWREQRLAASGRSAVFPLWGRDTSELAREFTSLGFRAVVACVRRDLLDASVAGRAYDGRLLAELPPDVDPCGENGEFHTFVHDGPVFAAPVAFELGRPHERDGMAYRELLSPRAGRPASACGPRAGRPGSRPAA